MKIRKLLSSFLSVAMITSMFTSMMVAHAAETPTLTATTGYEEGCITVTVSYSGFENFVEYSGGRKINVRGISAMSFEVLTDNESLVYDGAETLVSGVSAGATAAKVAFNASTTEGYITKTSGDLVKFYFIAAETAKANFTISDPKIRVGEYVRGVESAPQDYAGAEAVKLNNASYGSSDPVLADFAALNVAIAAYEAKTEADYTAESWATAKAAYDTAKAIDQTTVTDQTVVDAATNALNNAVAALVLKPVVVDKLEVKPDAVRSKEMPDGKLTFGFGGNVEITGTKSFTKLVFALEDTVNSKSASYTWEFDTAINASVSYGLNITGCPAGSNITATVTAE